MREVCREAVAQVNAGARETAAQKGCAGCKTRLREEVWVVTRRIRAAKPARRCSERGEFGCGSAERAGAVQQVSCSCGGAAERAAGGRRADEDDVSEDLVGGRFGGVAAGERDAVRVGKREQAVEKAVEPARIARGGPGQSEREKCR